MTPIEQTRLKLYCMELTSLLLKHNIQPPRVASDEECRRTMAVYPTQTPWEIAFDIVRDRLLGVEDAKGTVTNFFSIGGLRELSALRYPPRDE